MHTLDYFGLFHKISTLSKKTIMVESLGQRDNGGTGCPCSVTSWNQVVKLSGDEMHSSVRIDIARTSAVLSSTLSFAPLRPAFYRDQAIFETWLPYTGVRSPADHSLGF